MLGNRVEVRLSGPPETINGELRRQSIEGVWVYYGWAETVGVHFYPQHRIIEIIDRGPVYR